MRYVRGVTLLCAVWSLSLAHVGAREAGVNLAGAWEMNRDLSSAPGSAPAEPDGPERGRPPMRRGSGAGGRGPGGGGGGFGGGVGGGDGRPRGGPPVGALSREDMAARRALVQEALTMPARMTITQDGDTVVVIEPDGVVRTYVANGVAEKHQLTSGTIETRAKWAGATLRMEIGVGARMTIIRTFEVSDDPRRLEVTTAFEGGPRDRGQRTVYDEVPAAR